MLDTIQFEKLVRRKIAGWYSTLEYEDKAVARIVAQRQEIINLLASTKRPGIANVLEYLDNSGFFYRASSPNGHHNWPGGLAEHSLGTYRIAEARNQSIGLAPDSVIIAAILHDTCKSDRFWFKGRNIRQHTPKCSLDSLHSARSIAILNDCGLSLTNEERLAIRWHMKDQWHRPHDLNERREHAKALKDKLWNLVFHADKDDATAHHGRKRKTVATS